MGLDRAGAMKYTKERRKTWTERLRNNTYNKIYLLTLILIATYTKSFDERAGCYPMQALTKVGDY
jgi:hypothetical protein